MSEDQPAPSGGTYIPLHHLTAAYSAFHALDTNHTYNYALDLAKKLDPLNVTIEPGYTTLNVTGVMLMTMKLESARAMGRLRRVDGSTSYKLRSDA